VTTIWTTAGETFEITVSRELSKVLSKFGDAGAFEVTAATSKSERPAADCASAQVAAKKQVMMPYFVHCNLVMV
jgi:hypothetical protein